MSLNPKVPVPILAQNQTYIYHITHIDNLPGIINSGCVMSDARRRRGECNATSIGHEHIKDRRMRRPVLLAAGGVLGDYVPFNFCPRSVMLHSIWRGRVASYGGGQDRVVHLVTTAQAAATLGRPWAFTDRHAELVEAEYFDDLVHLPRLRWDIVNSNDWGGDQRRPFKQAEFLVHDHVSWTAIRWIGTMNEDTRAEVERIVTGGPDAPQVLVHREWYYP